MTEPLYPWQEDAWARLQRTRSRDRLPHALLVSGPAGTGIRAFAERLAQALLCASDVGSAPCGACRPCTLFDAGTHPDRVRLEPAETGKAIPIDAVRGLSARLALTAGAERKVAWIDPAEAMTTEAANSLLKTLEEPSAGTSILLVSRRPGRLPATIRSRCQRITFGLPPRSLAERWLEEQGIGGAGDWLARAGGAPLAALSLARSAEAGESDPVATALLDALEQGAVPGAALDLNVALSESVPVLAATIEDLIRLKRAPATARLRRPDLRDRLGRVAARLDERALFHYLDALYRSVPGASSSLRGDIQLQGLMADAARMAAGQGETRR